MSRRGRKRKFPENYVLPNLSSESEFDEDFAGLNEPLEQRDGHRRQMAREAQVDAHGTQARGTQVRGTQARGTQARGTQDDGHANRERGHHEAQENHGVSDVEHDELPDIPDLQQEAGFMHSEEDDNNNDNHVLGGVPDVDNPRVNDDPDDDEHFEAPDEDENGVASESDGNLNLNLLNLNLLFFLFLKMGIIFFFKKKNFF